MRWPVCRSCQGLCVLLTPKSGVSPTRVGSLGSRRRPAQAAAGTAARLRSAYAPVDAAYKSAKNRDVHPARPDEFRPIALGALSVWPPVVLAPMAGVTNYPFRAVCRGFGAGLYVSEMIT